MKTIREEFEAYAISEGYVSVNVKDEYGNYESYMLNVMWKSYVAGFNIKGKWYG